MKTAMRALAGASAVCAALAVGMTAAAAAPAASAAPGASAALVSNVATAQALQPWPVLSEGRNTTAPVTVRSLQYLLNARGAKLTVDGLFGPKTKAAVIAFQRRHGLVASGVVRAGTWRALIVTVRLGSVGPAVRAVQDQINFRNLKNGRTLVVDGIFGRRPRPRSALSSTPCRSKSPASPWTGSSGRKPGRRSSPRRCPAEPPFANRMTGRPIPAGHAAARGYLSRCQAPLTSASKVTNE